MKLTRDLLNAVHNKTNGHCWYCGVELPPFSSWQTDHQIPRSKDGPDAIENLIPACRGCNIRKGNKNVAEYRRAIAQRTARTIGVAIETLEAIEEYQYWDENGPPKWLSSIVSILAELANSADSATPQFYGDPVYDSPIQEPELVTQLEIEA